MKIVIISLFALPIWLLTTSAIFGQEKDSQVLTTIAFGSCARERQEQPVWKDVIAIKPQLFLMIGDNHYADFWERNGKIAMRPVPNVERIEEAYQALARQPGFVELGKQCELMATWDDHDYGANDQGSDFHLRKESQQEFVKFFKFAASHPIHNQQGIYHSKTFGTAGQRVQILMLDTRFHRDKLERSKNRRGRGPYVATTDKSRTMLGEDQWKWLKEQLQQPAEIRLIASSIQLVADEHGWETWGNFPHERQRLYDLIRDTNASGVVVVSGDRHLVEISCDDERNVPYPIWDFTSSGLTQKPGSIQEKNRYRIGPVKREQNFGQIRIDWREPVEKTRIHLDGLGENGTTITRQTIFLDSLKQAAGKK